MLATHPAALKLSSRMWFIEEAATPITMSAWRMRPQHLSEIDETAF
jgi:hypothetical protein